MLIERRPTVNARASIRGPAIPVTALDLARLHGDTPVVDLLLKSGATGGAPVASIQPASMRRGNTIQAAVLSSLPLCSALTRARAESWMLLLPQPEPVSYGCRARAEERLPGGRNRHRPSR